MNTVLIKILKIKLRNTPLIIWQIPAGGLSLVTEGLVEMHNVALSGWGTGLKTSLKRSKIDKHWKSSVVAFFVWQVMSPHQFIKCHKGHKSHKGCVLKRYLGDAVSHFKRESQWFLYEEIFIQVWNISEKMHQILSQPCFARPSFQMCNKQIEKFRFSAQFGGIGNNWCGAQIYILVSTVLDMFLAIRVIARE